MKSLDSNQESLGSVSSKGEQNKVSKAFHRQVFEKKLDFREAKQVVNDRQKDKASLGGKIGFQETNRASKVFHRQKDKAKSWRKDWIPTRKASGVFHRQESKTKSQRKDWIPGGKQNLKGFSLTGL
jgi:hypothetical protein